MYLLYGAKQQMQKVKDDEEKIIVELLKKKETVSIDDLTISCNLNSSIIASVLLTIELQGVVQSLPGKLYCIKKIYAPLLGRI